MIDTNLNFTRNLVSFNLCFDPLIHDKWPSGMNHYTWKEVREYLDASQKMRWEWQQTRVHLFDNAYAYALKSYLYGIWWNWI